MAATGPLTKTHKRHEKHSEILQQLEQVSEGGRRRETAEEKTRETW